MVHNESHSLLQSDNSGAGNATLKTWSESINLLQQLQQENARLRTIVAQLLLKNQTMRWQLGDHALEMMVSSASENERSTWLRTGAGPFVTTQE